MKNGRIGERDIPQLMRTEMEKVVDDITRSAWVDKADAQRRSYGTTLAKLMASAPERLEEKLTLGAGHRKIVLDWVGEGRAAYDLGFFLLLCGLGDSFAIGSALERVGFGTKQRREFALELERLSKKIEQFNAPDVPGIVGLLAVRIGTENVPEPVRRLPETLTTYAQWVKDWPPEEYRLLNTKEGTNYMLVYFSLFLPQRRNRWKVLEQLLDLSAYVVWGNAHEEARQLGLEAEEIRKRIGRFSRAFLAGMKEDVTEYLRYSQEAQNSPDRLFFPQFLRAKFYPDVPPPQKQS
jgi:hypothetical protein